MTSLRKLASITTQISKAYLTTWVDGGGVRHLVLAKHEYQDQSVVDLMIACAGYHWDAQTHDTDANGVVSCFECLSTCFEQEVADMDLDAIHHLDESDLVNHLIDHGAMAEGFDA